MPNIAYLLDTTHSLTLHDLCAALVPGYVNTATVTVTLTDAATGDEIDGQVWPATLDYVTGSNGTYRVTLPADLVVTDGQRLKAVVLADAGSGVQRTWHLSTLVAREG